MDLKMEIFFGNSLIPRLTVIRAQFIRVTDLVDGGGSRRLLIDESSSTIHKEQVNGFTLVRKDSK